MNLRAISAVLAGVSAASLFAAIQPPAPGQAPVPSKPDPAVPQPAAMPATPPSTTPAPKPTPPKQPLPSLDEALGIAKPSETNKPALPGSDAAPAVPPLPGDLERALNAEAPANELQRAVTLMERSAKRLETAGDTSIDTQRVQEETVRLLEALIKKSGQKQNQQSSSQQKPQDGSKQQQQPNQSQQSQSEQRPQPGSDPSNDPERGGTRNAQLRPAIDGARAAWGNLPQRVRQLLMQGSGDQFSKEYQRLTEEYYKRLGEGSN